MDDNAYDSVPASPTVGERMKRRVSARCGLRTREREREREKEREKEVGTSHNAHPAAALAGR
jgi:hypothetical protein